jgi:hypothetical protein
MITTDELLAIRNTLEWAADSPIQPSRLFAPTVQASPVSVGQPYTDRTPVYSLTAHRLPMGISAKTVDTGRVIAPKKEIDQPLAIEKARRGVG